MNLLRVLASQRNTERQVGQEINLVQNQKLGAEKHGRILQRLVFAFSHAEDNDLCRFSQVIAGGTDKVANIFDQQHVQIRQIPAGNRFLDHASIEMAGSARGYLQGGKTKTGETNRVVIRLNVAGEHGDSPRGSKSFKGALQQARFTCPRRADQIQAENSVLRKAGSQFVGDAAILIQNLPFEGNLGHTSSISR